MKIPDPKTNIRTKRIFLLLSVFVLIVLAGACFLLIRRESDPVQQTQEARPIGDIDYSEPNNNELNPTLDVIDTPKESTKPTTPSSSPIPITITSIDGNPLQVRVLISELLAAGSCSLLMEKDGSDSVLQTVDIFQSANSTTCKGFTIDRTNLSSGRWKVTITVSSGGRTGSTQQEITL